jgi:multiple sugar transport system ATP-binding protein
MADVSLEKVTKRFGDLVAVDGIDLHVADRELFVLVGPSGCGKTTTLRMISGLEDISEGTIRIGGRAVNDVAPRNRDVAMVFQHFALYPHLNVYRNMAFGLKMRRLPRAEIERRVREAARSLGIHELLGRKPAELSGGQRQRVALGRAIVRDPRVFLFDEPLSNLDVQLRSAMRRELVRLQRRLETTMIHVTHDQVEAMMMGGRIAVMHDGRILQTGRPEQIYDRPANRFVAAFIGSPPMNFVEATVAFRDQLPCVDAGQFSVTLPATASAALQAWSGRPVTLGFRPEAVVAGVGQSEQSSGLRAQVLGAQPLGSDMLLDLQCGDNQFVMRHNHRADYRRGQTLDLFLDASQCHVFDTASGEAILG